MGKHSKKNRWIAIIMTFVMLITVLVPKLESWANGGWNHDSYGWYYMMGSDYYVGQWAKLDGEWYYFDSSGYMESSCYRDGYWLGASGAWVNGYSGGTWKVNSSGWWFEDGSWYPAGEWLKINGSYYYFGISGYMECNCYRDGCWISDSGAWDTNYSNGTWKFDDYGWWYEDDGWYPVNTGLWIDGDYYWFDGFGYWDREESNRRKDDGSAGSNIGKGTGSGSGSGSYKFNVGDKSYDGETTDASVYSYEVIPMVAPFNSYYYIKTDNPDPDSFRFYDHFTKYSDSDGTEPFTDISQQIFADVKYENTNTCRVKGGYIAYSGGCLIDGGELTLQQEEISSNSEGGWTSTYKDTSIKVNIPSLVDSVDYLIQTYGNSQKSYFDNLTGIQDGLNNICLYYGVWILGDVVKMKSEKYVDDKSVVGECYYGILSAGHADQLFYMGSPYTRQDSKAMLTSYLYPYILDSLGFPGMMAAVAVRLDPNATCKRDSYTHYLVHITHNGETQSYGGAGHGGGQGINIENIAYYYSFDGSSNDAYKRCYFDTLRSDIQNYGKLSIDSNLDKNGLKWSSIRKTVGTDGSYVRINGSNWSSSDNDGVYKGVSEVFSYIYDNGSNTEDVTFSGIGCFSNCWFDGRYFNDYEQFYKGALFDETVQKVQPSLAFKDYKLMANIPEKYTFHGMALERSGYNSTTGVWKDFMTFTYDSSSKTWKNNLLNNIYYYDPEKRTEVFLKDDPTYGSAFVDACTITKDEAKSMNVDRNTNKNPSEYYIYDMTVQPGTYHKD
ncbi:MAG: hypothetical protein K5865_07345 [Eubacterium sp.]|nr:hypothetical protein [Eubacterium sp.]